MLTDHFELEDKTGYNIIQLYSKNPFWLHVNKIKQFLTFRNYKQQFIMQWHNWTMLQADYKTLWPVHWWRHSKTEWNVYNSPELKISPSQFKDSRNFYYKLILHAYFKSQMLRALVPLQIWKFSEKNSYQILL